MSLKKCSLACPLNVYDIFALNKNGFALVEILMISQMIKIKPNLKIADHEMVNFEEIKKIF